MTTATKLTADETFDVLERLADAAESVADVAKALHFADGRLSDSFADDSPIHQAGHVVEAAAWDVMYWLGEGTSHRDQLRKASGTLRKVIAIERSGDAS